MNYDAVKSEILACLENIESRREAPMGVDALATRHSCQPASQMQASLASLAKAKGKGKGGPTNKEGTNVEARKTTKVNRRVRVGPIHGARRGTARGSRKSQSDWNESDWYKRRKRSWNYHISKGKVF